MEPIKTGSGKTARANIEALRRQRIPAIDQQALLIQKLEALADQAYTTIRMMREQGNLLRLQAIDAKQMVVALRNRKKLDVEL